MTDTFRKKVATDLLTYTTATYLVQFLGIATSFSMRYFLEPELMGVWSLLDLVLNYGLYSNLGVLTALYTEMPYHLGRKDLAKAKEIRDVSFSFTLVGSVFVAVLFVVWAVFAGTSSSPQMRTGVMAVALILIATSLYNFYVALMWALKDFVSLSRAIILNASLYLLFVFIFVSRAKLNGLLVSVLLSISMAAGYLAYRARIRDMKIRLERGPLWELLKMGAPLVVVGFAYTLFMSIDRLMITKYLGIKALGHYSIALLVMGYANVFPKLLSIVVFPSMQEDFGRSQSRSEIARFVVKPATLLAYSLPFLLGGAYLLVPSLVHALLPKYEEGLPSMRVFLLGSFFISLCQPIQAYLTTIYKRWQTLPIVASGALTALAATFVLIHRGMGLVGVALGISAGFFVYFTVMTFYVFGHFGVFWKSLGFYLETLACFLYYAVVVLGVERWVRPFGSALADGAMQCVALGVCCVPLFVIADKKTGALRSLWTAVKERRSPKPALAAEDGL